MNPRKAMLSILQLFAGFSFFAAAIFFYSLPILPKLRLAISDMLLGSPNICHLMGTFLAAASFILIGGFYFLSRGRHFRIQMGKNAVSIDATVIHKTIEEFFKRHFGVQIGLSDLSVIRGGKLELEVFVAPSEGKGEEELFAEVQKQLVSFLHETFGYSKPFGLIVKSK